MERRDDLPGDAIDVEVPPTDAIAPVAAGAPAPVDELPIVARLAIEIRSDGTRTVARGAMQDAASGQDVRIEVTAGTLLELGLQLGAQLRSQLRSQIKAQVGATLRRGLLELPRAMLRRRREPDE
jgi:hypothetical protein